MLDPYLPACGLMHYHSLQNGRLAMLGFSGMVTQSVLSGHGFPYVY